MKSGVNSSLHPLVTIQNFVFIFLKKMCGIAPRETLIIYKKAIAINKCQLLMKQSSISDLTFLPNKTFLEMICIFLE